MLRKVRRKRERRGKSRKPTVKQLEASLTDKTAKLETKVEETVESVRSLSESSSAQMRALEDRILHTHTETKQEISSVQENLRQLMETAKRLVEHQTLDRLLAGIRDEFGRAFGESKHHVVNLSKRVEEDTARIAEAEATLAKIKEELDRRITSVATELQTTQVKVGELESVKGPVEQFKQELSDVKDRLESLSLKLSEIESEIKRLKNELDQTTASYQTRLGGLESALDVARRSVESLREALDELKETSESEVQELRKLVESKTEPKEKPLPSTSTE